LEIAIALSQKFEYNGIEEDDEVIIEAAKSFSMKLHNKWGVGKKTSCGDSGLVMFISTLDRVCFISKGSALDLILTSGRLHYVINHVMKPFLKRNDMKGAIEVGISHLVDMINRGPPSFLETSKYVLFENMEFLLFIVLVAGFVFFMDMVKSRQQREYAEAHSQLSQLDRENALALQGRYTCTSCPICFEDFRLPENSSESEPMLQQRIIGSDGLPIRLLRCGHVFDETCYQTWISSGQGDVTVCPICKQDVAASPSQQSSTLHRRTNSRTNDNDNNILDYNRYRQERLFRLARLANRYPRYIRPTQIQRWGGQDYQGTLVQDPDFVKNDPTLAPSSSGSRTTSNFGG